MTTTQECDVIFKLLYTHHGCPPPTYQDGNAKKHTEWDYRQELPKKIPRLVDLNVKIDRFSINYVPFESWALNATPEWWTANNKVKHHRDTHFDCATLENLIGALSALFLLNYYLYRDKVLEGSLQPVTELFDIDLPMSKRLHLGLCCYDLPLP